MADMNENKKSSQTEPSTGTDKINAEKDVQKEQQKKDKKQDASKEAKKLRSELAALKNQLEETKKAADEANDKYLRLAAEYDNFRKRSQKEREGIYSDAAADSVKELLPLIDNLQRATQYTNPEKVAEGVGMILNSLPDVLGKLKIESFGEKGEQFDPNIHNAVMHTEDTSFGENEVVEVLQQGYRLGDKIIRYAMVKVAN